MNFRVFGAIVIAANCSVSVSGASAMDDATKADVQCLVAIMTTGPQIEKAAPGSTQVAAMYYFGRIDGRNPNLDLEEAIREVAPTMSRADIGQADMRCGNLLTARGQAMEKIGQDLMLDPTGTKKSSHAPRGS